MDKAVNFFSDKYDEIEKANRHLEERVIQLESEKKRSSAIKSLEYWKISTIFNSTLEGTAYLFMV